MKNTFFVYANNGKKNLHGGVCSDIYKTIKIYDGLIHLLPKGQKLNNLVYLEMHPTEEQAQMRLIDFGKMTLEKKIELVETLNPEWMDITAEILQVQAW